MVSFIITAYKEPKTIGKAITSLLDTSYSGYDGPKELITVIPDDETNKVAKKTMQKFQEVTWKQLIDPLKGKPVALNMAFNEAQGEILVLTDGDVYFETNAVKELLQVFNDTNVIGATGRPVSADTRNNMLGFFSHLLADAAHHKRLITLGGHQSGRSAQIVNHSLPFFVLSGYILAMRNFKFTIPEDTLVDDAYISYYLFNKQQKLAYTPEAKVAVHYPTNIKDWYKQKLRSVGGYIQLWKYPGIIKPETKVRNFWKELEYFWFPIKYAKNLQELIWALALYPLRLWMWLVIFYQQKLCNKNLAEIWVRVESTK